MRKWNIIVVCINVVYMVAVGSVFAREKGNPEENLISASSGFVENLKGLQKTLEKRPAKVEPKKWSSIRAGAIELKTKAARLREMIVTAERSGDKLGVENGNIQARLTSLAANFQRRAKEAEDQARELQEPLASVVLREKNVWLDWAKTAELFQENYSDLLTQYQEHVAGLKPLDSVLKRLEEGANDCAELAGVGEKLENASALATFVEEINSILDSFNTLSDETKGLISKAEPSTSAIMHRATTVASRAHQEPVNDFRRWTSLEGKSFTGRLVSVQGDRVRIKNQKDGAVYSIPISRFVAGDRDVIRLFASELPTGLAMN